ncbi:hypothetical protein B0H63DRAFT_510254 [Podospora didyma]|uniref:Uncharacterized protein n=1 Tax=Podospora didyma TaxID=330526 RepID=A0AAE0NQ07_9PEZI|nr:hypothetical protein B0H63DRAFT_510254 [Podospora didyma]
MTNKQKECPVGAIEIHIPMTREQACDSGVFGLFGEETAFVDLSNHLEFDSLIDRLDAARGGPGPYYGITKALHDSGTNLYQNLFPIGSSLYDPDDSDDDGNDILWPRRTVDQTSPLCATSLKIKYYWLITQLIYDESGLDTLYIDQVLSNIQEYPTEEADINSRRLPQYELRCRGASSSAWKDAPVLRQQHELHLCKAPFEVLGFVMRHWDTTVKKFLLFAK